LRVAQDGVVRLLGVRGWGLERLPKYERRIFSTPGLALAAQGERETRQALDGLEVSLVRPGRVVGRDGDVEIGVGVLGVARPLNADAEGGAGGDGLLGHRRTVGHGGSGEEEERSVCHRC
jgi:hypothetical protein